MTRKLPRRIPFAAFSRLLKPGTPGIRARLMAIPRMVSATLKGDYDGGTRLLLMAAAAVYIISPIDLVPEGVFLLFGLVDDVAISVYFVAAVLDETERFLDWEKGHRPALEGQVLPSPISGSLDTHPVDGE